MKTHTMTALAAGAIGYVLGAKAGRARYEQIRHAARRVTDDPRVQDVAHRAQEKAEEVAPGATQRFTSGVKDERRVDRTTPASATNPIPGG